MHRLKFVIIPLLITVWQLAAKSTGPISKVYNTCIMTT